MRSIGFGSVILGITLIIKQDMLIERACTFACFLCGQSFYRLFKFRIINSEALLHTFSGFRSVHTEVL